MDLTQAQREYWSMVTYGTAASPEALRAIVLELHRQHAAGETPHIDGEPELDEDARQAAQLGRLRAIVTRAATQTVFYGEMFRSLGLDPASLEWADLSRLPVTRKADLRERPADFVTADSVPLYRSFTGGTTGDKPIGLWWSELELELSALMQAIRTLDFAEMQHDVLLMMNDSTQFLSAGVNTRTGALVGDQRIWGRIDNPDTSLDQLMEEHRYGARRMKPSTAVTRASYWGALVTAARRRGLGPADFGVRFLNTSGEITTAGLLRRMRETFGDVLIYDVYGSTELWGATGATCPAGHVHFFGGAHPELLDPDTLAPAAPGGVGTLVATMLPPLRETTLLLRYDTEDLFRALDGPLDCEWPAPAFGPMMGKRSLAVRHADGSFSYPRQVLEALEAFDELPLPARCGFWAVDGGLAVEVVAPGADEALRARIAERLRAEGLPLAQLILRESRAELERPYPLRDSVG